MEAEKLQPVVYISPHLLTIAKSQQDRSLTSLQFSMKGNRWVNEHQPKATRVGFKGTKTSEKN